MSSNDNEFSHLIELGNSKYEVAPGESDIRNWVVKNENGNILGEVQDLIFDSRERKVKFIVLDLDRNELNLKERRILIPVEYAEINEAYKNVIFKGLMPNELATLPTYEKGKITRNSIDLTMSTFISSMRNENTAPQNFTSSGGVSAGRTEEYKRPESSVSQDRNLSNNGHVFYTVIGAFDEPRQTQAAIEYLLNHDFRKDEITVSTRQADVSHDQNNRDESGISHFFRSLFNNDEEAGRYSEAAARGSVVTVDVTSSDKAEEAARILDQHGSLDMSQSRQAHVDLAERKTGASRIFERRTNR